MLKRPWLEALAVARKPASDSPEGLGTVAQGRFELKACLGEGAFGSVYEAFDRAQGATVALKVLKRLNPDSVLRFKREFRELHELHHRNLVRLRELLHSDGHWMLVMELVEGGDFLTYVQESAWPLLCTDADNDGPVRPANERHKAEHPSVDYARLRDCLHQLAEGLSFLHDTGRVHRDIKPPNLRVTPSGRLVVLDFGLVTSAGNMSLSTANEVVGTVAYMAPEQAASGEVGPAADWYAVGTLLFEALTGTLPFIGSSLHVLMAKQRELEHSARSLAPSTPADLDQLCSALLRVDPSLRAGAEAILSLGQSRSPNRALHSMSPSPTGVAAQRTQATGLVGREAELATLEEAFASASQGMLVTLHVQGESGIGKTRLLSHFAEHVTLAYGALVLSSRCRETETLAYKAVDGIIDSLAQTLRKLPLEECRALLPRRAGLLPLVFPVLSRVRAIQEASASTRGAQDKLALRALVFTALREVLSRVSDKRPLVVVIDDFQWADAESLALIGELLRPPDPPAMLFIIASRPTGQCTEAIQHGIGQVLDPWHASRTISVGPLEHHDTMQLALQLMDGRDQHRARALATEAEGSPLLLEVLAHYAPGLMDTGHPPTLDTAIAHFLAQLDPPELELAMLTCLAGAPTPRHALMQAIDVTAPDFDRATATLKAARLIRMQGVGAAETLEPSHDRLRVAVVQSIKPVQATALHAWLAHALERCPDVDRERVAQHFVQAGLKERGARTAVLAGDQARDALAFQKAARMYRLAMTLDPSLAKERSMLLKLGETLAQAGECSEAADVLLQAVEGAGASEALEMRRRASELLLQAGRIDDGLAVAETLMRSIGLVLPKTTAAALRRASWFWLRRKLRGEKYVLRDQSEIAHDELLRIDVLHSLSSALGTIHSATAMALQAQGFLAALDAAEPSRIAHAMALDAIGLYFMGQPHLVRPRIEQARRLEASSSRADVRVILHFTEVFACAWEEDVPRSFEQLELAEKVLNEECTGLAWLRDAVVATTLYQAWNYGCWDLLISRFPPLIRELGQRRDPFARTRNLVTSAVPYYLLCDRQDLAEKAMAEVATLDVGGPSFESCTGRLAFAMQRMARNPGAGQAYLDFYARYMKGHAWMNEPLMSPLLGTAALLHAELARRDTAGRKGHLQRAERASSLLGNRKNRLKVIGSLRFAPLVAAAIHDARGDREQAMAAYSAVEAYSDAKGYGPVLRGVAYARRGQLIGGERGADMVKEVGEALAAMGAKRPLLVLDAQYPGVLELDHKAVEPYL